MNETGFRIEVGRVYKVITRRNTKEHLYLLDSDNRESIILIETICADDSIISFIVIILM
jgi:hypothetical protein